MSKRSHRKKVKGTLVNHRIWGFDKDDKPLGTLGTRHYINNNRKDIREVIKVGD